MAARRTRTATASQRAQAASDRQVKLADLHQRIVAEVGKLTDGEQWRRWLAFAANFHDYSFNNTIAIWMQRPDATWVAGFERWKKMGRHVRKGERGIAILAPVISRATPGGASAPGDARDPAAAAPDPPSADDTELAQADPALADPAATGPVPARVLRGFRIVYVFDVSQTDGDGPDTPNPPTRVNTSIELLVGRAPPGLWDALVAVATDHDYTVERGDCDTANGYTDFINRRIRIRADIDDAQAVKTMAHEVAHLLLHTGEDFGWGTSAGCRGQREVEAESVAFLVAAHHGLDTSSYTFGYVTWWAQRAATSVDSEKQSPEDIVRATGHRVISTAFAITEATDAHLGLAAPDLSPMLSERISASVARTHTLRTAHETTAAQPAASDSTPAPVADAPPAAAASPTARAFPPLRLTPEVAPIAPIAFGSAVPARAQPPRRR